MTLTSQQAALLLCRIPKLGLRSCKKLIDHFGSAKKVLEAPVNKLLQVSGIGPSHLRQIATWKTYLPEVKKEEKNLISTATTPFVYQSKNYPLTLTHTSDPPVVYFQQGRVNWSNPRIISIVGTRTPTGEGERLCEELLQSIAPFHPLIVSGFARGIDIYAHKKALDLGLETVAVLGHAFGQWYPKEHRHYVAPLLQQGAFITEFWSNDPFDRTNFLRRNRIIAGVAHATVVIESGERGGSLVTAAHALAYGREVFAFPGRPSDTKSKGCLSLIKNDQARMIRHGKDLVDWLGWKKATSKQRQQLPLFIELSLEEKQLLNELKQPTSLDELALKSKRSIATVAALLLQLELKGVVRSLGGKTFERS
ncbi:MAG: DNA-processing protein DprA [Flavobacteriaceae bacterium]